MIDVFQFESPYGLIGQWFNTVYLTKYIRRLLEQRNKTITMVFRASRNAERDRPAEEWTTEFIRKAQTIIDVRCTN